MGLFYVDSSALVKLVEKEAESDALKAFLAAGPAVTSSELVLAELPIAIRRRQGARTHARTTRSKLERAIALLVAIDLIAVEPSLLELAGRLDAPLRTLDAIHVASALVIGSGLDGFVSYDRRQLRAARALGLPVVTPT